MSHAERDALLTSREVAEQFRVSQVTVSRWVKAGHLEAIRTPGGGHLRFRRSDVEAFFANGAPELDGAA